MGRLTSDIAAGMRQSMPPLRFAQDNRVRQAINNNWPNNKGAIKTALAEELKLIILDGKMVPDDVFNEAVMAINFMVDVGEKKEDCLEALYKGLELIEVVRLRV